MSPTDPHAPSVLLTGLDGSNPLAFLAALGALRILDIAARGAGDPLPRLSWIDEGCWRPRLHGPTGLESLLATLADDRATWADDPALLLAYDSEGQRVELDAETTATRKKGAKKAAKIIRDLKPPPEVMRGFLQDLVVSAEDPAASDPRARLRLRRTMDTAAAYGSEIIQANKGDTKPTALHFTAGPQQFLKAIAELHAGITEDDLREALEGPWRGESTLPNMGWDATNARLYALRASAPSSDKKTTIAGADWLAYIGLAALPAFPVGRKLHTTAITGGWKDSMMTWPLWEGPTTYRAAAALLRTAKLADLKPAARRARGIAAVFRAGIVRSDQGGYGSFSPASAL